MGSSDFLIPSAASNASGSGYGSTRGTGWTMRPKRSAPDSSRSSSTGTMPMPVSSSTTARWSGVPSTHAVPSVGCPAKGSSAAGVKIRMRAVPPPSAGRTNVVSEKPISRASACIVSASSSRASVKTASWFPASARSVKTSTTTNRRAGTSSTLSGFGRNIVSAVAGAIVVRDLVKSYGGVEALRAISFEVAEGEVFGLLGPNGAGKTTTVEILEGYRPRDGGDASVLGQDPGDSPRALRERIGVVLQHSENVPLLTVRELHLMFAGYYDSPRDVDEVIELVGLGEKRGARVKTLSGGQKRRLDLGIALVGDPDLVFLDEPTTGFDPAARRTAWELVRSLRSLGKTILLTTHYLDEAQQLADRVAVIREGRLVRIGTPHELIGVAPDVEIRYREGGRELVVTTG